VFYRYFEMSEANDETVYLAEHVISIHGQNIHDTLGVYSTGEKAMKQLEWVQAETKERSMSNASLTFQIWKIPLNAKRKDGVFSLYAKIKL
jgi:hypothetical protein